MLYLQIFLHTSLKNEDNFADLKHSFHLKDGFRIDVAVISPTPTSYCNTSRSFKSRDTYTGDPEIVAAKLNYRSLYRSSYESTDT